MTPRQDGDRKCSSSLFGQDVIAPELVFGVGDVWVLAGHLGDGPVTASPLGGLVLVGSW